MARAAADHGGRWGLPWEREDGETREGERRERRRRRRGEEWATWRKRLFFFGARLRGTNKARAALARGHEAWQTS